MDFDKIIEELILSNSSYVENLNEGDILSVETALKQLVEKTDASCEEAPCVSPYDVGRALNCLYRNVSFKKIEPRIDMLKKCCDMGAKNFGLYLQLPLWIKLFYEKARHRPGTFRNAGKARRIFDVLLSSLDVIYALDSDERIGQLCIALVLMGLIIDSESSVLSILQKTSLMTAMDSSGEQLLWGQDSDTKNKRMLYPLGSVAGQIYRLMLRDDAMKKKIVNLDSKGINFSIKKFLINQKIPRSDRPKSLRTLQIWATDEFGQTFPPIIVDYLKGTISSVARDENCETGVMKDEDELLEDIIILEDVFGEINERDNEVITKISQALRKGDSSVLLEYESGSSPFSPIIKYLVKYGYLLIQGKVFTQEKNEVSTFANYFRQLAKPFAIIEPWVSIEDIGDWHELYDNILLSKDSSQERYATGKNLRRFHKWLMNINNCIPDIDFEDLEGFVPEEQTIRAKIVTVGEFVEVKKILLKSARDGGHLEWARLILFILAYRTGARSFDLCSLKRCHLRGSKHNFEIVIPKSKSKSGRRWLPLSDLVPRGEQMLIEWWLMKVAPSALNAYLFSLDGELPSTSRLTRPVIKLLKQITGDKMVVYHTLRHSFATARLIRIFVNLVPEIKKLDIPWIKEILVDQECLKDSVLLTANQPSKRHFYQIALLMGHLSPATTLRHYVHCMHIVIQGYMLEYESRLNLEQVAPLLGYKKSRAYTLVKRFMKDDRKIQLVDALPYMRASLR